MRTVLSLTGVAGLVALAVRNRQALRRRVNTRVVRVGR